MKICVAQTRPIKGDINRNITNHKKWIDQAVSKGADLVVFPELSLTGYEPKLAAALATNQDDSRFNDFQAISDSQQIAIGVGMPTKNKEGICISMIIFQPHKARQTYSKKYLHPDEEPFFVSGENLTGIVIGDSNVAFAICYEISIPQHVEDARKNGADVYIASVAKTTNGVENANKSLPEIANKYSMTVAMSNCIGSSDDFVSAGKTSIWNNKGSLVGQLDNTNEGLLIIDTSSQKLL